MNTTAPQISRAASDRSAHALTLIELLVTLVLSILVLGMVLPLLHQLMRPSTHLELPLAPAWQRSLQADLAELVSPEKCGVPVIQILPASGIQPYPEIVVETFCRAGDDRGGAAGRGPSEVRYVLEPDPATHTLALARYAKGWHDDAATRHVLASQVNSWNVGEQGAPVPGSADQAAATSSDAQPWASGGVLEVEVISSDLSQRTLLWVPRLAEPSTAVTQPSDQSQPGPEETP